MATRRGARVEEIEKLRDIWVSDVARVLSRPLESALQGLERLPGFESSAEMKGLHATLLRAARIIRDLEQYARIEGRHIELERRELDLGVFLREAIRDLRGITEGRPVHLLIRGPMAGVSADPSAIRQIVSNLVANAVSYGEPGSPIGVEAVFGKGGVTISVTNRGAGIPADQLSRIFESRFTRNLERREMGLPGLGLGLYVTRGLVEAHGGRIWAESEPGRETAIRFTLPVGRKS